MFDYRSRIVSRSDRSIAQEALGNALMSTSTSNPLIEEPTTPQVSKKTSSAILAHEGQDDVNLSTSPAQNAQVTTSTPLNNVVDIPAPRKSPEATTVSNADDVKVREVLQSVFFSSNLHKYLQ